MNIFSVTNIKFRSIFFLLLTFVFFNNILAQETKNKEDEKRKKEKLKISAFRVGIDFSQIGYSLLTKGVRSNSIYGDIMLNNSHFLLAEIGLADITRNGFVNNFSQKDSSFTYKNHGMYYRFGIDVNTIKNKTKDDAVILGLRYAFTNFEHSITYAGIDTSYFGGYNRTFQNNGLSASWLELVSGIKLHFFQNFYLTTTLRIKIRTSVSNLYELEVSEIPGFGINKSSVFAINYHILYRIPFKKKKKMLDK